MCVNIIMSSMQTGMFFASTMVMVSIALVMAVIVTNIYAKKNSSERCPAWALSFASRFYPSYHLQHMTEHRTPDQERNRRKIFDISSIPNGKLNVAGRRRTAATTIGGGGTLGGSSGASPCSGLGGSAEVLSGPPHRSRSLQRGRRIDYSEDLMLKQIRRSETEGSDASQDRRDHARAKAEWRLVALLADRIFLWVFVALSVVTHTTLFVQMLPHAGR